MSKKISIISSGYNIVWFVYTVHYLILFSILASERFSIIAAQYRYGNIFALNVVMNYIALILAVIGVLIAHQASRTDRQYWNVANRVIHTLMILWVFGGSLWVLLLMM